MGTWTLHFLSLKKKKKKTWKISSIVGLKYSARVNLRSWQQQQTRLRKIQATFMCTPYWHAMCSPKAHLIIISRERLGAQSGRGKPHKIGPFFPFPIQFFEQPAGPEWPPDPDGQCGKRHATVASLIVSTGYAHSSTQGEMSVAMTFTIAISVLRDST